MTLTQDRTRRITSTDGPPQVEADWSFVRSLRWLASHAFAITTIAVFILAGFWQLGRHNDRVEENTAIAARAGNEPASVARTIEMVGSGEVDFWPVADRGRWLDTDVVRVVNRSLNGVAGEWVVGVFETSDRTTVLVNRGFVPLNAEIEPPPDGGQGTTEIEGFLRSSRVREGISVADTGEGTRVPRLNVDAIAARLPADVVEPVGAWVQLQAPIGQGFPERVPLPEQTNGPHLSYMGQWFLFAGMGAVVYGLILRRIARPSRRSVIPPPLED